MLFLPNALDSVYSDTGKERKISWPENGYFAGTLIKCRAPYTLYILSRISGYVANRLIIMGSGSDESIY
jgi:hypothetical protein